jgi:hypothetical protein
MNVRGALVGFLLAGFGVLAFSSMTPGEDPRVKSAARIEVGLVLASNAYVVDRGGERANF